MKLYALLSVALTFAAPIVENCESTAMPPTTTVSIPTAPCTESVLVPTSIAAVIAATSTESCTSIVQEAATSSTPCAESSPTTTSIVSPPCAEATLMPSYGSSPAQEQMPVQQATYLLNATQPVATPASATAATQSVLEASSYPTSEPLSQSVAAAPYGINIPGYSILSLQNVSPTEAVDAPAGSYAAIATDVPESSALPTAQASYLTSEPTPLLAAAVYTALPTYSAAPAQVIAPTGTYTSIPANVPQSISQPAAQQVPSTPAYVAKPAKKSKCLHKKKTLTTNQATSSAPVSATSNTPIVVGVPVNVPQQPAAVAVLAASSAIQPPPPVPVIPGGLTLAPNGPPPGIPILGSPA